MHKNPKEKNRIKQYVDTKLRQIAYWFHQKNQINWNICICDDIVDSKSSWGEFKGLAEVLLVNEAFV